MEPQFDWDEGNLGHTLKHGLTHAEIESVFRDSKRYIAPIEQQKFPEERFFCVGFVSNHLAPKKLHTVIFCIRHEKIRPISARRDYRSEEVAYWSTQSWKG